MISSTAEPNRMLILRASELLNHRTRDIFVVYSKLWPHVELTGIDVRADAKRTAVRYNRLL